MSPDAAVMTENRAMAPPNFTGIRFRSSIWPVVGLLLLSPFVGEVLLGNLPARLVYLMPFLVPLYGAGATLVREAGRRTGGGWVSIMFFALAYGTIQPGLVEMSLFNPEFAGWDFSDLYLPSIGISPYYTLVFVVGHAVWSIGVPIALVEALVPEKRTLPWLGPLGLGVMVLLFGLGVWMYWTEFQETEDFMASVPQLASAGIAALAFIAGGFLIRIKPASAPCALSPGGAGLLAFVLSSGFFAAPENWLGVAAKVTTLLVGFGVFGKLIARSDWTPTHSVAIAGGAIATYAWGALVVADASGYNQLIDYAAMASIDLIALVIVWVAWRTSRKGA